MECRVRVLFVCIGNSCRSQMAEGFARHKHNDVLDPASAGVHPATIIQSETIAVMAEKSVLLENQYPKNIRSISSDSVDLVVNMSGLPVMPKVPNFKGGNLIWAVTDPIGRSFEVYNDVRDRIETMVDELAKSVERAGGLPGALPSPHD